MCYASVLRNRDVQERKCGSLCIMAGSIALLAIVSALARAEGSVATDPASNVTREERASLQKKDEEVAKRREERERIERERQTGLDKAREERRKSGSLDGIQPFAPDAKLYEIDPLLKTAYLMYRDHENRDRDKTVAAFEEYIKRNPDSVFLPEVYFLLSSLYSGNATRGETIDFAKMRDYDLKANELYGGKLNYQASTVKYYLCFMPGTLETRMEYYDWLRRFLEAGTSNDFYPINTIECCIAGRPTEFTKEEVEMIWENWKSNLLPSLVNATERQIFQDSFQRGRCAQVDLAVLAGKYPNTELGRQARHALTDVNEALGQYFASLALDPTMSTANVGGTASCPNDKALLEEKRPSDLSAGVAQADEGVLAVRRPSAPLADVGEHAGLAPSRALFFALVLGLVILCLLVAAMKCGDKKGKKGSSI